jgi:hypothetical protein
MTVFYCQIRGSRNLEGQIPVFISPRNRVAQALGCLFVASYDSQGYGGGIRVRVRVRDNLRLAVYLQLVRLGAKPLDGHDHLKSKSHYD